MHDLTALRVHIVNDLGFVLILIFGGSYHRMMVWLLRRYNGNSLVKIVQLVEKGAGRK